ncbi:hypothetical protein Trydic_g11026 [Trypoxylus dichotomus]
MEHRLWAIEQRKNVLRTDESKSDLFDSKRRIFVRREKGKQAVVSCIVPTVKHGGGSSGLSIIDDNFVLQDNDPRDTSRLCREYLPAVDRESDIKIITWLPKSADLNLIELLWEELHRSKTKSTNFQCCVMEVIEL